MICEKVYYREINRQREEPCRPADNVSVNGLRTLCRLTYVFCAGEPHNLVKCPPAIIFADRISFFVADMVISRYQYSYRVGLCTLALARLPFGVVSDGRHLPVTAVIFVNSLSIHLP